MTQITKTVLNSGGISIAQSKEIIGCPEPYCSLKSAVIVPLWEGENVSGTLKFYRVHDLISELDVEIAKGLSNLLSNQLRISELEKKSKLALNAEIRALQAQINPHFLFNSLNVVNSLIRTDPSKAREVLRDLSDFFRKNMQSLKGEITLKDELVHVDKYISVSKARFGDKIRIDYNIQVNQSIKILPLLIQPIVENAVLHGVLEKPEGGVVSVRMSQYEAPDGNEFLEIEVIDDGIGMSEDTIDRIMSGKAEDSIGFINVKQRIEKHYGELSQFIVDSQIGIGTKVKMILPISSL